MNDNTELMELWRRIASGKLPDGVTVTVTDDHLNVRAKFTRTIHFGIAPDELHREIMLLIMDAYEEAGYRFMRIMSHQTLAYTFNVYNRGGRFLGEATNAREVIALLELLVELGEREG